jgi:hypothetical protein
MFQGEADAEGEMDEEEVKPEEKPMAMTGVEGARGSWSKLRGWDGNEFNSILTLRDGQKAWMERMQGRRKNGRGSEFKVGGDE